MSCMIVFKEEEIMIEMSLDEMSTVDGGGLISCIAGGVAFAMIGTILALPYAAVTGNGSAVAKMAVFAGSIGMWVGAGMPLP